MKSEQAKEEKTKDAIIELKSSTELPSNKENSTEMEMTEGEHKK